MLRFGILGAHHGHRGAHVKVASEKPDRFEIVGFYEPDREYVDRNLREWSEEFGIETRAFDSAEALLESDVEAIVVEGMVSQNIAYARQALEAGKHVLLEKPAGGRLDEFAEIQEIARKNDLVLNLAYLFRFHPDQRELLRLVRAGALGDLFYFRAHMSKPWAWHRRLEKEFSMFKGGVYFEMAGHYLDLMVALLGEPQRVTPHLAAQYGDRLHVDNAVVVHEYERCLATVDTATMHVIVNDTRRLEVYGTKGSAINMPYGEGKLDLFLEEPFEQFHIGWNRLEQEETPEHPTMLDELAVCIRREREPEFSFEHDLTVHKVLLAGCGAPDGNAIRS